LEELGRHILLDRRGLALAHPHEHPAANRLCGVGARSKLAGRLGVRPLADEAGSAMRTHVAQGYDLSGLVAEEVHLVAEHLPVQRLLAEFRRWQGHVPVLPQAEWRDLRTEVPAARPAARVVPLRAAGRSLRHAA